VETEDHYDELSEAQQFVLEALRDAEPLRRIFERDHPDEFVLADALAAVRRWIGGLDNKKELEAAQAALFHDYLQPLVLAHQSARAYRVALYASKIVQATLEPKRASYHIERAFWDAERALEDDD
jgi:hypothetical protein